MTTTTLPNGWAENTFNSGNRVNGPKLLSSINFSEFSAGGTVTKQFFNALDRGAKRRCFILVNYMDIAMTGQRFTLLDSIVNTTRSSGSSNSTSANVGTAANSGTTPNILIIDGTPKNFAGDTGDFINAPVDSFSLALTIGATAPTYGKIELYSIELY